MLKRRPYQESCLVKILRRFKDGFNRLLVVWPTGVGKTVLFAGIPETLDFANRVKSGRRYRMLVLVHRDELIKQAVESILEWNPWLTEDDVGVECGARFAKDFHKVIVASVATLGREASTRLFRFHAEEFGAIVVDEAHHCIADTYQRILDYFRVYDDKEILLIGVTATPNRSDRRALGKVFQEIVDHITILWAIQNGWLVDLVGKTVRMQQSINDVKRLSSDNEVAHAIDNLVNDDFVARAWLQEANGLKTIMFCANVDHCKNMAAAFQCLGVRAEAIWGDDPLRETKIAQHKTGEIQVLCNCNILIEGYDDRDIECVALNRPTDSESLYTQMIGRGARLPSILKQLGLDNLLEAIAAGHEIKKTKCLILDFVYASSKHSLVTLPSLIGLGANLDMQGKGLAELAEVVEKVKKTRPKFDFTTFTDASKLQAVAEHVDLLKVAYAPEILEFSKFQWIKRPPSDYVLMLGNGDHLSTMYTVEGIWVVTGVIGNNRLIKYFKSDLREAIAWADAQVRIYGGTQTEARAKREAPWHKKPPSAGQMSLAKLMGLTVPPGTTAGELSKKMNERLALQDKEAALRQAELDRKFRKL
jgi:superfamily II DNA or RNA helicase